MTVFTKYLINLIIYSILVAILAIGILTQVPEKFILPGKILSLQILFFVGSNAALHLLLLKASKGKPQDSIRAFMAGFGAKLFLYMGVLLIYRLINKAGFFPFAVWFLFLYFFYLVYEAVALLKFFKKQ